MINLQNELLLLGDEKYRDFQAKLMPNINKDSIIGIRVPKLRLFARQYIKSNDYEEFLNTLPHKYYDENMLHGLIISDLKDFQLAIKYVNNFLPYVDNWAVCDIMSPKIFKKNKDKLLNEINIWIKSNHTYTIRFGVEMLMSHYLDDDFDIKYLDMVANIKSDEYYVNMMVAWYFATSLAKHYEDTIKYIEKGILTKWVHNKTIQKALESYRITDKQKVYLKSLKIY